MIYKEEHILQNINGAYADDTFSNGLEEARAGTLQKVGEESLVVEEAVHRVGEAHLIIEEAMYHPLLCHIQEIIIFCRLIRS